jgi:hypothetical protein
MKPLTQLEFTTVSLLPWLTFTAPLSLQPKQELWRYVRKSAIRPVIYAIGGDDGQDDRNPYSAVTYLDTQLGQWLPGTDASDGASRARVAPLRNKRSVCGVAAFQGKVYVVGGYNGERAVESVEVFDPQANTWTMAAPISQRRYVFAFQL